MAFDEALALRVRALLVATAGVAEKRMFGGLAFLIHGNMAVGVHRAELIVRLDPAAAAHALAEPGARVFDITGRLMAEIRSRSRRVSGLTSGRCQKLSGIGDSVAHGRQESR